MSPRIRKRLRARNRLRAAAAASATVAAASCLTLAMPAAAASRPDHHPSAPRAASARGHRVPAPFSVTTRVRHKKGAKAFDPLITVRSGGYRVGSADEPAGLNGETFQATGNGADPTPHTCITAGNGTCTMDFTTTATQTYTVRPIGTPGGWFVDEGLGIYNGTNPPATNPAAPYSTVTTASIGINGSATVPGTGQTGTGINTRGNRMAFSKADTVEPHTCGLNIGMAFDLSSSVSAAPNRVPDYRQAGRAFIDALQGTPSRVAVYTFGTNAPATSGTGSLGAHANNGDLGLTTVATPGGAQELRSKIGQIDVVGSQWTNWDGVLWRMANDNANAGRDDHFDEVVLITDGDPTLYGRPNGTTRASVTTRFIDVEHGIFSANQLKGTPGTREEHPATIVVGINAASPGSQANLRAVSGSEEFRPIDWDELADTLRSLAREQCDGTITVVKHIVPHDGTVEDATDGGAGWEFTSSTPHQEKSTEADTSSVNFATETEPGDPSAGRPTTITAHERNGYTFMSNATHCRYIDSGERVSYEQHANGLWVRPNPNQAITCDVYNRAPSPEVVLRVEKHPEPGTFTHVGERIEYSYKVTNDGDMTVHDILIHDDKIPANVTHCDHTTLEPGHYTFCHAVYVIQPEDIEAGHVLNHAYATGEIENGNGGNEGPGRPAISPETEAEIESGEVPVTG